MRTRLSRDARVRRVAVSGRFPWEDRIDSEDWQYPHNFYLDDIAWQPLAALLVEIQPLAEMEWEDDKFRF